VVQVDALICTPVAAGPSHVPSAIYACSECGQNVWASIKTGVPIVETGVLVVCVPCALGHDDIGLNFIVKPEIVAEALDAIRKRGDT
jgi:hypothetical protein